MAIFFVDHSFIHSGRETGLFIFAVILQTGHLIHKYLLNTDYWPGVVLHVGYVLLGDSHSPGYVALREISMLPS